MNHKEIIKSLLEKTQKGELDWKKEHHYDGGHWYQLIVDNHRITVHKGNIFNILDGTFQNILVDGYFIGTSWKLFKEIDKSFDNKRYTMVTKLIDSLPIGT